MNSYVLQLLYASCQHCKYELIKKFGILYYCPICFLNFQLLLKPVCICRCKNSNLIVFPEGMMARPPGSILPCPPQQQTAQAGLRSNSPSMTGLGVLNATNRLIFPVQQQQQTAMQQGMPQPQQQQNNVVGLPGPSPTTSNPGLSPFGSNPLSQGSTTTTTSANNQFAVTSNGPVSLPQVSPAGQNSNQFSDMLKSNRIPPSPSGFLQQAQQQQQQQQGMAANNQGVTQNGTARIPGTPADSVTTPLPATSGPKSVNSSRGPSPAPTTPLQASPAAVAAASMGESFLSSKYTL